MRISDHEGNMRFCSCSTSGKVAYSSKSLQMEHLTCLWNEISAVSNGIGQKRNLWPGFPEGSQWRTRFSPSESGSTAGLFGGFLCTVETCVMVSTVWILSKHLLTWISIANLWRLRWRSFQLLWPGPLEDWRKVIVHVFKIGIAAMIKKWRELNHLTT